MSYEVKRESVVDVSCVTIGSRGMIRVLERPFHRFGSITAEAAAAFRADDGRESFRFHGRKSVNHDIFDPVRMVTRTAAILVPIARPGEWFVELWVQWILVHLVTPQIIRTLL